MIVRRKTPTANPPYGSAPAARTLRSCPSFIFRMPLPMPHACLGHEWAAFHELFGTYAGELLRIAAVPEVLCPAESSPERLLLRIRTGSGSCCLLSSRTIRQGLPCFYVRVCDTDDCCRNSPGLIPWKLLKTRQKLLASANPTICAISATGVLDSFRK